MWVGGINRTQQPVPNRVNCLTGASFQGLLVYCPPFISHQDGGGSRLFAAAPIHAKIGTFCPWEDFA